MIICICLHLMSRNSNTMNEKKAPHWGTFLHISGGAYNPDFGAFLSSLFSTEIKCSCILFCLPYCELDINDIILYRALCLIPLLAMPGNHLPGTIWGQGPCTLGISLDKWICNSLMCSATSDLYDTSQIFFCDISSATINTSHNVFRYTKASFPWSLS